MMTIAEQLTFCQSCEHSLMMDNQVVCSLTEAAPTFEGHCPSFTWDKAKHKKTEKKKEVRRKLYRQYSIRKVASVPWRRRVPQGVKIAYFIRDNIDTYSASTRLALLCSLFPLAICLFPWYYVCVVAIAVAIPNLWRLHKLYSRPKRKALAFDLEGIDAPIIGQKFYWNDIRFLMVWEVHDKKNEYYQRQLGVYLYGRPDPYIIPLRSIAESENWVFSWAEAYRPLWECQPQLPLLGKKHPMHKKANELVKQMRMPMYKKGRFAGRSRPSRMSRWKAYGEY